MQHHQQILLSKVLTLASFRRKMSLVSGHFDHCNHHILTGDVQKMFTTSLLTITLAGLVNTTTVGQQPEWQTSYSQARELSAKAQKPIAVFITASAIELPAEAVAELNKNFVALKIDTTTETGKELAAAFKVSEGMVISNKTGTTIATRVAGPVASTNLVSTLTSYNCCSPAPAISYNPGAITAPVASTCVGCNQQPRPVLNSIQAVGGYVQNVGQAVFAPITNRVCNGPNCGGGVVYQPIMGTCNGPNCRR
jgi:hypothetical protein